MPCAGAALKPLFLAADHWRRQRVLGRLTVTLIVPWPTIFGIPAVDRELDRRRRTLRHHRAHRDPGPAGSTPTIGCCTSTRAVPAGSGRRLPYDLLHFVPRHRPRPGWVTSPSHGPRRTDRPSEDDSGSDAHVTGMIEVDPGTLAHRRHPGLWGLGDAADVAASRSGGALRKQVAVVADNIARRRAGRPLVDYDGYSTAPITVGRDRLVLAEFDRAGALTPERAGDRPGPPAAPHLGVRPLSATRALLAQHLEGPGLAGSQPCCDEPRTTRSVTAMFT